MPSANLVRIKGMNLAQHESAQHRLQRTAAPPLMVRSPVCLISRCWQSIPFTLPLPLSQFVVRQESWPFLQGESPYWVRPNPPPIPSVAVVEEVYSRTIQLKRTQGTTQAARETAIPDPSLRSGQGLDTAPLARMMQAAMV
jgi:hypothetical protein